MSTHESSVVYFEIPARDLDRAQAFYSRLFELTMERENVDGYEMAFFPEEFGHGISGGIVAGESYVPSFDGSRVYFSVDDVQKYLDRAVALGGSVLFPTRSIGPRGWVGEFADSEGNRVALHAKA